MKYLWMPLMESTVSDNDTPFPRRLRQIPPTTALDWELRRRVNSFPDILNKRRGPARSSPGIPGNLRKYNLEQARSAREGGGYSPLCPEGSGRGTAEDKEYEGGGIADTTLAKRANAAFRIRRKNPQSAAGDNLGTQNREAGTKKPGRLNPVTAGVEERFLILHRFEQCEPGFSAQNPRLIILDAQGAGGSGGYTLDNLFFIKAAGEHLGHGEGQAVNRTVDIMAVKIGADDMGPEASVEDRPAADMDIETRSAVSDIEEYAALPGGVSLGYDPSVIADDASRLTVETVGNDITRPQGVQYLSQRRAGFPDVNHQGKIGLPGRG